mmetsp:Transcript_8010/g.15940  ORF Transcript_8010/g.15940 Transcript_8010/m.15940 type:complete len:339 (+) Transcript_8010:45-1061(+)
MEKGVFFYILENYLIFFFSFSLKRQNIKYTLNIFKLLVENTKKKRTQSFINYSCKFKIFFLEWLLMASRFGFFSDRFLFNRFYHNILYFFYIFRESCIKQLGFQKLKKKKSKQIHFFKDFLFYRYKKIFLCSRFCKTKRIQLRWFTWNFRSWVYRGWYYTKKIFGSKDRKSKKGSSFVRILGKSLGIPSFSFFWEKKLLSIIPHFIRKYKGVNWIRVKEAFEFYMIRGQFLNSYFSIKLKSGIKECFLQNTSSVKNFFSESPPRNFELRVNRGFKLYELKKEALVENHSSFKQLYFCIFKIFNTLLGKKNQHFSKKRDYGFSSNIESKLLVIKWEIKT